MNAMDQPTWQLVLQAAEHLKATVGDFRLDEIVTVVQLFEPGRGKTSIHPVVQGMTSNAGKGPPSPCGKPLVRIRHGLYRLEGEVIAVEPRSASEPRSPRSSRIRISKEGRSDRVEKRVTGLIGEFATCVHVFEEQTPFTRSGQYSWHRATLDRRQSFSNVREAIDDEVFLDHLYQTLQVWGIGRRASHLVPRPQFGTRLRECADEIALFDDLRLDDPELDVLATATGLWQLIEDLAVVENVSLIVPGTKTLHHLLPELVPPMDRAWTGTFFLWSPAAPQFQQQSTFVEAFSTFARIARATDPSNYVGEGWRTSSSKVIDNAIIGYCKLHDIAPGHS